MKHLQDPTHKAYKRRITSAPVAAIDLTRNAAASASVARSANFVDLTKKISPYASQYTSGAKSTSYASSQSTKSSTGQSHVFKTAKEPKKQQIDPSTLNADQTLAAQQIFSGSNAFLTGAAGVGKSYLLNYLIQGLKEKHSDETVVVAAATGIAATHIGGVTIHSWAGVRLGVGGARVLVPRVMSNNAAVARWRKAKVLILDEVSVQYVPYTLVNFDCSHHHIFF